MASIFNCETDQTRVSSPWLVSLGSSPLRSRSETPITTPLTDTANEGCPNGVQADLLSDYRINKLEAEPQMGPTEYKLHLLLRPRRQFRSMSTYQSTSKYAKLKDGSFTPPLASSSQSRNDRLQHLTTQLLWRMQQSSPQHTGTSLDTVVPQLSSDGTDLDTIAVPAKLPPGLEESRGALYEIGVSDDGTLVGLTNDEMDESIKTLRVMAASLGCKVEILRMIIVGEGEWDDLTQPNLVVRGSLWVAEAFVTPGLKNNMATFLSWGTDPDANEPSSTDQLRVTLTGPTASGKSTLLGTLTTGTLDNGRGMSRQSLLKHRHEVESGMTSSVAQELIGYKNGTIINYQSHYNDMPWGEIHELSSEGRLVFVSDSAGHPRYRRTTLRGIIGWAPHWMVLCVAANDGESSSVFSSAGSQGEPDLALAHLVLCLELRSPLAVVITKLDKASKGSLQHTLGKLLTAIKTAGRVPKIIQPDQVCHATLTHIPDSDNAKVKSVVDSITASSDFTRVIPILLTSAVKGQGIGMTHSLLKNLPIPAPPKANELSPEQPASIFHIDDVFNVPVLRNARPDSMCDQDTETGIVVSGYLRFGVLKVGDEIVIGPFPSEDDPKKTQSPRDQPSGGGMGLSVSHRASSELAKLALKNTVLASQVGIKWHTARVASIRNLRLPVSKLQADQVGTIGLIVLPSPGSQVGADGHQEAKSRGLSIRRGMVMAVLSQHMINSGMSLQAASSITIQVMYRNAERLQVGALVNLYAACVRSAARIRSMSKVRVCIDHDVTTGNGGDEEGLFGMDTENGKDTSQDMAEVVIDLISSREWIEMDSQVMLLEGGSKDKTGLEGITGRVVRVSE
ncbi:GTP-binding protein [Ceratocystis lukuohia]|uniref:GTP-binding protein n=1 Tax=Ceratocystis lukuohia TaxID=2019550 RepID=A0ABR4MAW1_9PEZI